MWVPATAEQIEAAARAGELEETPSFDAKADLPESKKNSDLAIDVAAMTTEGGTLLYGVAEDEHRRPTIPRPIPLAGKADRIGQIVSTSIAEVPYINVREHPCSDDPARGYVLIVVPQSARAPHQVIVGGDHRFYGRGATGNRRLNEGEIARLYDRRQSWQVDRERVLQDVVTHAPVAPIAGQGFIHGFTRPVVTDQGILERATAAFGGAQPMHQRLLSIIHTTKLRGAYGPSLEQAVHWRRHGADMWRLSTYGEEERADLKDLTGLVDLSVNIDGRGHLFCGRATDTTLNDPEHPLIIEVVIAGNVEAFFTVVAKLYEAAGYHGSVDVGLALTGIEGARSERGRRNRTFHSGPTYPAGAFTRTDRVAAAELHAADDIAHRLLRHFFEATTGIDGYNPWAEQKNR
jgi:hypothetical protein